MINAALYKKGFIGSLKLIAVFFAILTLYVTVIMMMYDPSVASALDEFVAAMPEIMAMVGMRADEATYVGFAASYLFGFLMLVLPMVFTILMSNTLLVRNIDRGTMTFLLSAPVKRRNVIATQMAVLLSGIVLMILYVTVLGTIIGVSTYPAEFNAGRFILLNAGAMCLHLFIAGICFLCGALFQDTKRALAIGAGIPLVSLLFQMLGNVGGNAEFAKYLSFFSLFDPAAIAAGEWTALIGCSILLVLSAAAHVAAVMLFERRDLHI